MLIVEDEQVLLWSLERALEALPGVETICCGSVEAALAHLVELRPGVIVLDIHLPGLSGIDLLEDLAVQGAGVPVIVTTAYRAQHEQALRRFPNVEVLEKPVPLELLRERIQARLARRDRVDREEEEKDAVFEVADYLQLAAMTRASVAVEVTLADGRRGRIEVWHGEAWTAECGELAARDALGELIFAARTGMRMRQLARPTGERRFHHRLELLLLEAAKDHDEAPAAPRAAPVEAAASPSAAEDFERCFRNGLRAYLERHLEEAERLFCRCLELRPDEPRVHHNLARIRQTRSPA